MGTWQSAKQEEASIKERMKELEKEKKDLIARGEAAEKELIEIKAILGNPQDISKAVQKLASDNERLQSEFTKLSSEKESGSWKEWEKK